MRASVPASACAIVPPPAPLPMMTTSNLCVGADTIYCASAKLEG
jgi:hypothetical protein